MSDDINCYKDSKDGLIFEQIPKVMSEIGAIGKNQQNQAQRWNFRGIDDIYNAVHLLLSKHGVFTAPKIINKQHKEFTSRKGAAGVYVIIDYKYKFFAKDGSHFYADAIGEAMDYGDKAYNKAASISQKYAFLQVFCIPTKEIKDPDFEVHERKGKYIIPIGSNKGQEISGANIEQLDKLCEWLDTEMTGNRYKGSIEQANELIEKVLTFKKGK